MKTFLITSAVLLLAVGSSLARDTTPGGPGLRIVHDEGTGAAGSAIPEGTSRGNLYFCDFELHGGDWTTEDWTAKSEGFWSVSDFNAANLDPATPGNRAWYCGTEFEPCDGEPVNHGYGNLWTEVLSWRGTVGQPGLPVVVRVTADLNVDTEAAYDLLYLEYPAPDGSWIRAAAWDGVQQGDPITPGVRADVGFTVDSAAYGGIDGADVVLRWTFISDGGWSDQDCRHVTEAGAAQIDNITVTFDQGSGPVQIGPTETCDGSATQWAPVLGVDGFGDYAHVVDQLNDIDPYHTNYTPQLCFVADPQMQRERGLPEAYGISWTYGPYGNIVNPGGGLNGGAIHNAWLSPPIDFGGAINPEQGALLSFDVYRHEELGDDSPGIFYFWHVRSTTDPTGESGWSPWRNRSLIYYGGPGYLHAELDITDLLLQGKEYVQVAVGVINAEWADYDGYDGTPAPYFDNIRVDSYYRYGPVIRTDYRDLAVDAFPASGTLDSNDPASDAVRFATLDGDSVSFRIVPVRPDAAIYGIPTLHYMIRPNPVYDPVRQYPLSGEANGEQDPLDENVWHFRLPDEGLFFPGDLMHYYVEAADAIGGGDIQTRRFPEDLSFFGVFPGDPGYQFRSYPDILEIAALPGVGPNGQEDQHRILFWNDNWAGGGEDEWYFALANEGYVEGRDYDRFDTVAHPRMGLGCAADAALLKGYDVILYGTGPGGLYTIQDPTRGDCDDVGVLESWLDLGDRKLLLAGNHLARELASGDSGSLHLLTERIGVAFVDSDVRSVLQSYQSPAVRTVRNNSLLPGSDDWVAHNGPPTLYTFDAVEPLTGTETVARWLDRYGAPVDDYAAVSRRYDSVKQVDVVYLPCDFSLLWDDFDTHHPFEPLAMRTQLLGAFLETAGMTPGTTTPVAEVLPTAFRVAGPCPNPFNPSTRIEYDLDRAKHLRIQVYDLRGALVTTLLDELRPAGPGSVEWHGTDTTGRAVPSGTYFCVSRAGSEEVIDKMTLLK